MMADMNDKQPTSTETHKRKHIQSRKGTYVFIAQRLQEEEEDGFEVFVPHGRAVFPRDLQQVHQGALALLEALVVVGQFLQQVGDQVGVVLSD